MFVPDTEAQSEPWQSRFWLMIGDLGFDTVNLRLLGFSSSIGDKIRLIDNKIRASLTNTFFGTTRVVMRGITRETKSTRSHTLDNFVQYTIMTYPFLYLATSITSLKARMR